MVVLASFRLFDKTSVDLSACSPTVSSPTTYFKLAHTLSRLGTGSVSGVLGVLGVSWDMLFCSTLSGFIDRDTLAPMPSTSLLTDTIVAVPSTPSALVEPI